MTIPTPPAAPPVPAPPTAPAAWTWLIYMAGDNNLEGAGRADLREMQSVGSSPALNIIVQFDTSADRAARLRVEKGRLKTLQRMPGVNCGDPRALRDFIQWGAREFPAERYLICIWNHGSGWEDLPPDYDYDAMRAIRAVRARRALFNPTAESVRQKPIPARAIAIDCGSRDFLDNRELREALQGALPGSRAADILGCDACLMNLLEIGYEMKDAARILVGSEEVEPGTGWPYAAVLEALADRPDMAPELLARTIVAEYGAWYRRLRETATQSALDLGRVRAAAQALDALAGALLEGLPGLAGTALLARERAQKFEMPEYVDLADLARELQRRLSAKSRASAAAAAVIGAVEGDGNGGAGLVLANSVVGSRVRRARGVSIYFPSKDRYSPDYGSLSISRDARWSRLLKALFRA